MSGGSWDYLYGHMGNAAEKLRASRDPLRRAFGRQMKLFAEAMYAIEWVDSGDSSPPSDADAIKKALGKKWPLKKLAALIEEAEEAIGQFQLAYAEAKTLCDRKDGETR